MSKNSFFTGLIVGLIISMTTTISIYFYLQINNINTPQITYMEDLINNNNKGHDDWKWTYGKWPTDGEFKVSILANEKGDTLYRVQLFTTDKIVYPCKSLGQSKHFDLSLPLIKSLRFDANAINENGTKSKTFITLNINSL